MKFKGKFLIPTVLLFCINMLTMEKDVSVFSVTPADKNSFVLQLNNANEAEIQVTLKDMQGVTLCDETIMQSSLSHRKYNIENLPVGDYILIVSYGNVIQIQSIKKGYGTLEIDDQDLRTVYQPSFKQHLNYLDLNMLCLSNMMVSLYISDEEGNVIYKESTQTKESLNKRFNLSQLEAGSYVFSVEIVDGVVIKEFNELIEWYPPNNTLNKYVAIKQ